MHLAFFSSSDFTIPIIKSILSRQKDTLWSVFADQYGNLVNKTKKEDFDSIIPGWWHQSDLLSLIKNHLLLNSLWDYVNEPALLQFIVTQPDREHRGKILQNPISAFGHSCGLELFQPNKINREVEKFENLVESLLIDMAVLASYGQILSEQVLSAPNFGFLNWHPSLLPKYRGATPMQTALANGDKTTGLSWLDMTREMDAGDLYLQIPVKLQSSQTIIGLSSIMGNLGADTWALAIMAKVLASINT